MLSEDDRRLGAESLRRHSYAGHKLRAALHRTGHDLHGAEPGSAGPKLPRQCLYPPGQDAHVDADGARGTAPLMSEVQAWTEQRSAETCERHFAQRGVPCSGYRSVRDNLEHPQLELRESFATVRDAAGEFRVPNLPFRMGDTRPRVAPSVPALGADTDEVLARLAGWSPAQLQSLRPPAQDGPN